VVYFGIASSLNGKRSQKEKTKNAPVSHDRLQRKNMVAITSNIEVYRMIGTSYNVGII
jgi:hypothetical protein